MSWKQNQGNYKPMGIHEKHVTWGAFLPGSLSLYMQRFQQRCQLRISPHSCFSGQTLEDLQEEYDEYHVWEQTFPSLKPHWEK